MKAKIQMSGTSPMGLKFAHASDHLWCVSESKLQRKRNMVLRRESRLWIADLIICPDRCYQDMISAKLRSSLRVQVKQFSSSVSLNYKCKSTKVKMKIFLANRDLPTHMHSSVNYIFRKQDKDIWFCMRAAWMNYNDFQDLIQMFSDSPCVHL